MSMCQCYAPENPWPIFTIYLCPQNRTVHAQRKVKSAQFWGHKHFHANFQKTVAAYYNACKSVTGVILAAKQLLWQLFNSLNTSLTQRDKLLRSTCYQYSWKHTQQYKTITYKPEQFYYLCLQCMLLIQASYRVQLLGRPCTLSMLQTYIQLCQATA